MFSTVLVIYVHAFEHRQEVVVDIRVAVDQADPPNPRIYRYGGRDNSC